MSYVIIIYITWSRPIQIIACVSTIPGIWKIYRINYKLLNKIIYSPLDLPPLLTSIALRNFLICWWFYLFKISDLLKNCHFLITKWFRSKPFQRLLCFLLSCLISNFKMLGCEKFMGMLCIRIRIELLILRNIVFFKSHVFLCTRGWRLHTWRSIVSRRSSLKRIRINSSFVE